MKHQQHGQKNQINVIGLIECLISRSNQDYFHNHPSSTFYRDHLPLFFEYAKEEIEIEFSQRLNHLRILLGSPNKQVPFQRLINMIGKQVKHPKGVFKSIIQLWSSYCRCKIKLLDQKKYQIYSDTVREIFKDEVGIFIEFIFRISEYLFKQLFIGYQNYKNQYTASQITNEQMIIFQQISISLTSNIFFQQIYFDLAEILTTDKNYWKEEEFQQTQDELKSQINIDAENCFYDSLNSLRQFYEEPEIIKKIQLLHTLRSNISADLQKYSIRQIEQNEDLMSNIYTYLFLNCKKNIQGACIYIQLILCCIFEQDNSKNNESIIHRFFLRYFDLKAYKIFTAIKNYSKIAMFKG